MFVGINHHLVSINPSVAVYIRHFKCKSYAARPSVLLLRLCNPLLKKIRSHLTAVPSAWRINTSRQLTMKLVLPAPPSLVSNGACWTSAISERLDFT